MVIFFCIAYDIQNQLYILFESASGYGLFERSESEEIGSQTDQVQQSVQDFGRFSKIIKLKSFQPFTSAEVALENQNDLSEGKNARKSS